MSRLPNTWISGLRASDVSFKPLSSSRPRSTPTDNDEGLRTNSKADNQKICRWWPENGVCFWANALSGLDSTTVGFDDGLF